MFKYQWAGQPPAALKCPTFHSQWNQMCPQWNSYKSIKQTCPHVRAMHWSITSISSLLINLFVVYLALHLSNSLSYSFSLGHYLINGSYLAPFNVEQSKWPKQRKVRRKTLKCFFFLLFFLFSKHKKVVKKIIFHSSRTAICVQHTELASQIK